MFGALSPRFLTATPTYSTPATVANEVLLSVSGKRPSSSPSMRESRADNIHLGKITSLTKNSKSKTLAGLLAGAGAGAGVAAYVIQHMDKAKKPVFAGSLPPGPPHAEIPVLLQAELDRRSSTSNDK
ncbi:MAG: hypothetical protein P8176_12190 [Gammaproteobacteria bacterium]